MRFVFTGDPKPKGRPRSRVVTQNDRAPYVHHYTDAQTEAFEGDIGLQVQAQLRQWANDPSIDGELRLPLARRVICSMRFNLRRPTSTPKRVTHPLKKPDVDNLAKGVLDALVKVNLLNDDNATTDLLLSKRFADEEHPVGTEVEITGWLA